MIKRLENYKSEGNNPEVSKPTLEELLTELEKNHQHDLLAIMLWEEYTPWLEKNNWALNVASILLWVSVAEGRIAANSGASHELYALKEAIV